MVLSTVEWRDEYNLGVEVVDKAHKALFSIVRKIITLTQDDNDAKRQRACIEGIKYFQNYVNEHFKQEEEYMREVKYSNYLAHKRRHDLMKNETLPALAKELADNEYSREAIQHFADVCLGWLTSHIIIEDQAIISNRKITWDFERTTNVKGVHMLFDDAMREMFKIKADLLSDSFDGIPLEKPICIEYVFANTEGKRVKAIFEYEEELVAAALAKMLNVSAIQVGDSAFAALNQICLSFIQRVAPLAKLMDGNYQLEKENRIDADNVKRQIKEEYFRYKMLFGTECGKFAFCFTKLLLGKDAVSIIEN